MSPPNLRGGGPVVRALEELGPLQGHGSISEGAQNQGTLNRGPSERGVI